MLSDMWSGEKQKNELMKNIMKRLVFLYSWVLQRILLCFIFEKTFSSLRLLFIYIGKSSSEKLRSGRSQIFFKISVLKNFKMFAKTPVFESLFNKAGALKTCIFIQKEIPTQVFSSEYCEIFKNSFLVEHFLFIILLRDDRILWTSLGTKLTCFIFLVPLLCFPL